MNYSESSPPYSPSFPTPSHSMPSPQPPTSAPAPAPAPLDYQDAMIRLTKLREYDTVFIVDDSASMSWDIAEGGGSRWKVAGDSLYELVNVATACDYDGVDIHFLNSKKEAKNVRRPEGVRQLFASVGRPEGGTKIGKVLERLLPRKGTYMKAIRAAGKEKKGCSWPKRRNYIIITDGEASDQDKLRDYLSDISRILDKYKAPPNHIGFQFVQIGDDPQATRFLEDLDNGFGCGMRRDIVDTFKSKGVGKALSPEELLKVMMGAVNRSLDDPSSNFTASNGKGLRVPIS